MHIETAKNVTTILLALAGGLLAYADQIGSLAGLVSPALANKWPLVVIGAQIARSVIAQVAKWIDDWADDGKLNNSIKCN